MTPLVPLLLAALVAVSTVAPAGTAPSAAIPSPSAPAPPAPSLRLRTVDAGFAAWSLDLGVSVGSSKAKVTPAPAPKSLCPLGDVNGDGLDDILVRQAPGQADGKAKFQALAGPAFATVLWTAEPRDSRLMRCGADVTGDGAPDPILATAPAEPASAGPAPVQDTRGQQTLTPVDAATGRALGSVSVDDAQTGAAPSGLPGSPDAGTVSTGDLLPAAPGTLIAVAAMRADVGGDAAGTQAGAARDDVRVEVVDASGQVQGTVPLPAGADAVAVAPLPEATGAVAVLTERQAASADGAPAGVPTVTVADAEGAVVWEREGEAGAGVPVLLPQAGDVDGDGREDLIVATAPPEMAVVASSGYEVLSGADGSVLTASGADTVGLQAALPFGDADGQGGDEVLVIRQDTPEATVELSVVDAQGAVAWVAEVPDGSVPANAVTDDNGNTAGFSDLTSDGAPDAAVAVPTGAGLEVVVVDGATGATAWDRSFEGADEVHEVPGGADDGSDGGSGSDLVVIDDDAATVTLIDGATGQVVWRVRGAAPAEPAVEVQPAGDVDGDGTADLLVTVASVGPSVPTADAAALHAVSGADGSTLWSGSGSEVGPAPAPLDVLSSTGEGSRPGGHALGWAVGAAGAAAVAAAALLVRRRRA
jgi:hypothetical protein